MKKGFLKCLALSLVLVSSLQFGSFAARKNVKFSDYKPKIQLAGLSKIKKNTFTMSSVDVSDNELKISDFAGFYELDLAKSHYFLEDEEIKSFLNEFCGSVDFITLNVEKNGKVTLGISFSSKKDGMDIQATLTETDQLIKNNMGEFVLDSSNPSARMKITTNISGIGIISFECDAPIDALSEDNGYDKFYLKNIDGVEYLVLVSEDGYDFFKKVL